MKNLILRCYFRCSGVVAIFLISVSVSCADSATSGNYTLNNGTLSNSGGSSASSNFQQKGNARIYSTEQSRGTLYAIQSGIPHIVPSVILYGDLNGDGIVDVADALRSLKIAIGLITPTASDQSRGDVGPLVNGKVVADGKIDITDAVLILEKTVGLVSL